MKLHRYTEPEPAAPAVVAVGNFDGVHLGHQRGLATAREEARRRNFGFGVITFDPHPAHLLRPGREPAAITPLPLRTELLESLGVEWLTVIEFTERFAAVSAEDFVERLLIGRFGARVVVQGANFRFGRGRQGDLERLRGLGAERGLEVIPAVEATFDGRTISSTRIRHALAAADLDAAGAMLGRPYQFGGRVVAGAGRGRELGFPTANLVPDAPVLVPDGVYAGEAELRSATGEARHPAVVHKGSRPTFGDAPSLEVHLIGFTGQVPEHAAGVRVRLSSFLREVRTFSGPAALVQQIDRDVAAALSG